MHPETRARRWLPLLLGIPLLCYLILPTRNFYWDGVAMAINIEKRQPASSLVYPSHLIYSLWGSWLYRSSAAAGLHIRALYLMQTANSVLAGLCVMLFYRCLRLRNMTPMLAVPMALVFGFSATWWRFATDANAYVPSVFLLLCAYVLIETRRSPVFTGAAQASAMMFHELAILFLPVALLRLRRNRRAMLTCAAAALIPVAIAYTAAYDATPKGSTHAGLLSWITSHSPDSGFSFNPLRDASFSMRGTLRLLFGGKLGDFTGDWISRAALATLLIATTVFLIYLWRASRAGAKILPPPLHLMLWAGIYVAFLFVWMPQNTFYRLFYLPPLIAILASTLADRRDTRTAVWLFVPVLAAWNFCFVTYPQSRPDFNTPLKFAMEQRSVWKPGTPIVFHAFHPDLWTISYFSPQAAWIGLDRADVPELDRDLNYAKTQNAPLWLEEVAYQMIEADPAGRQWLAAHDQPAELLDFKDDKHDFRFHCAR